MAKLADISDDEIKMNYPNFYELLQVMRCQWRSEERRLREDVLKERSSTLTIKFISSFCRNLLSNTTEDLDEAERNYVRRFFDQFIAESLEQSMESSGENVLVKAELRDFIGENGEFLSRYQKDHRKNPIKRCWSKYVVDMREKCLELLAALELPEDCREMKTWKDVMRLVEGVDKIRLECDRKELECERAEEEFLNTFRDLLSNFINYVDEFCVKKHPEYEDSVIKFTKRVAELIVLESKNYELRNLTHIYRGNVTQFLDEEWNELEKQENVLDEELAEARVRLDAFEALGDQFKQLAKRYNELDAKEKAITYAMNNI